MYIRFPASLIVPDEYSVCRGKLLNSRKGTHDEVQTTQHYRRQLFPSDAPFTVYLPTNEKPYLVWLYSSEIINTAWYCLFRPKRGGYIMPCSGSFQGKCLPSFSVCSFFLLLALLFVQNVSLSWWMYCAVTTYLPALVWICCFYVWGTKGRGDRNPGLKKKRKRLDQYCIPCNLCNCWL